MYRNVITKMSPHWNDQTKMTHDWNGQTESALTETAQTETAQTEMAQTEMAQTASAWLISCVPILTAVLSICILYWLFSGEIVQADS